MRLFFMFFIIAFIPPVLAIKNSDLVGKWSCINNNCPEVVQFTSDQHFAISKDKKQYHGWYWLSGAKTLRLQRHDGYEFSSTIEQVVPGKSLVISTEKFGQEVYTYAGQPTAKTAALVQKGVAGPPLAYDGLIKNPASAPWIGQWAIRDKEGVINEILDLSSDGIVQSRTNLQDTRLFFGRYTVAQGKLMIRMLNQNHRLHQWQIIFPQAEIMRLVDSKGKNYFYTRINRPQINKATFTKAVQSQKAIAERPVSDPVKKQQNSTNQMLQMQMEHQMQMQAIEMQNSVIRQQTDLINNISQDMNYNYEYSIDY